MQIVGYMILLVFYLCYFIKMFQQRKQGIQTDHMGKGKQGIQKKIEIMMKGTTIATFIIEILSIYLNTMTFPLIIRIMGIFLGIIGDIVFIASVLTMKDSWRAGVSYEEKTDLITNGIYQISRRFLVRIVFAEYLVRTCFQYCNILIFWILQTIKEHKRYSNC